MRPETAAAVRAARLAQRTADSREGADAVQFKQGIDIVTAADVACEDAIRAELKRAFPDYPVIGEERGGEVRAGSPYWLVDPICGTRCYASNVPLYCSNIALVEDGIVTAAAIAVGRSTEVLYAERGAGARLIAHADALDGLEDNREIAARAAAAARVVTVSASSNVVWMHGRQLAMAEFARRMWLADRWFLWAFTSTVGYAYLAMGRIAGAVQLPTDTGPSDPPVHTAAGCLIAEEAGATVRDLASGSPWTLASRSFVIAATPTLHRELMEIAKAAA